MEIKFIYKIIYNIIYIKLYPFLIPNSILLNHIKSRSKRQLHGIKPIWLKLKFELRISQVIVKVTYSYSQINLSMIQYYSSKGRLICCYNSRVKNISNQFTNRTILN